VTGQHRAMVIPRAGDALRWAEEHAREEDLILVTGSLYLVEKCELVEVMMRGLSLLRAFLIINPLIVVATAIYGSTTSWSRFGTRKAPFSCVCEGLGANAAAHCRSARHGRGLENIQPAKVTCLCPTMSAIWTRRSC